MNEKPILFSGPMIRALLSGAKTQTRRIITPQPTTFASFGGKLVDTGAWDWRCRNQSRKCLGTTWDILLREMLAYCPFGSVGTRLWVRETWQYSGWTDNGEPWIRYAADNSQRLIQPDEDLSETWADLSDPANTKIDGKAADRRWRPSIFMPRWASRITLEVTGIRVERVCDTSERDATAEGVEIIASVDHGSTNPIAAFRALWDSINGKRGYGCDTNCWVWCVSLRRILK